LSGLMGVSLGLLRPYRGNGSIYGRSTWGRSNPIRTWLRPRRRYAPAFAGSIPRERN
jgi:hypothetical protein